MSRSEEFAAHWPVVMTGFVGITLGAWGLPFYILGPLIKPLEAQFGWSRTSVIACASFLAAGLVIGTPIAGRLADRIGIRSVVITSIILFALCFGFVSQVGSALWKFQGLYFLTGLLGAGCGGVTYTRAIGGWFVKSRGLALGIALAGTGAAAFIAPNLVALVTSRGGPQLVFLSAACASLVVGLPIAFFGLKEPPRNAAAGPSRATPLNGATRREALCDPRFYIIASTVALYGMFNTSLLVYTVPMLIERGIEPVRAGQIASMYGIVSIFARLGSGWMLDRLPATYVGSVTFLTGAFGSILFANGSNQSAIFGVIAIGLLGGVEMDLMSFIILRYFGVLNYGAIYGLVLSVYTGFSIATPLISGGVLAIGGYTALCSAAACAFLAAAALFLALPRFAPAVKRVGGGGEAVF